jgi:hypothetical protein
MAYKIKHPKLAQLAAGMRHIPVRLLEQLGYAKPRKRSAKKKTSKRRAKTKTTTKRTTKRKGKKKTAAELHAFRVKQGKRLAAMRKKQLKRK